MWMKREDRKREEDRQLQSQRYSCTAPPPPPPGTVQLQMTLYLIVAPDTDVLLYMILLFKCFINDFHSFRIANSRC